MLFKILGVGLVTIITYITIKQTKPELALVLSMSGGLIMSLMLLSEVETIIDNFISFSSFNSFGSKITTPILKVLGVGYITEFCGELAEDSGNKFIASKIILGGKIAILVIALPVVQELISSILGLL